MPQITTRTQSKLEVKYNDLHVALACCVPYIEGCHMRVSHYKGPQIGFVAQCTYGHKVTAVYNWETDELTLTADLTPPKGEAGIRNKTTVLRVRRKNKIRKLVYWTLHHLLPDFGTLKL